MPQLRGAEAAEVRDWRKYRKAIMGTLAGLGVFLAAIFTHQPPVGILPLPLKPLGAKEWVLTNDYTTVISNVMVCVRAGFHTDLASLGVMDKPLGVSRDHPAIRRGALVHDALYAAQLLPREQADALLRYACLQDGMDPAKAEAAYLAVREWGWQAWERKPPKMIREARGLVEVWEK